jgi:hypothetical protein
MQTNKTNPPAVLRPVLRDPVTGNKFQVLKNAHKQTRGAVSRPSLKQFARQLAAQGDMDAVNWLFNKRANTRAPKKGIGKTTKKKGGSGK